MREYFALSAGGKRAFMNVRATHTLQIPTLPSSLHQLCTIPLHAHGPPLCFFALACQAGLGANDCLFVHTGAH